MKTTKITHSLTLLATAALMSAAFAAHAEDSRGRNLNREDAPAPIARGAGHRPVVAQPTPAIVQAQMNRPNVQNNNRFDRQAPVLRSVHTPPPVIVHRQVVVRRRVVIERPIYVERPVYTQPVIYAEAPAPVYYPEPAYTPEPAYYPEPAPTAYPAYEERGRNVAGAVGGAVIGGVIGNVIGGQMGQGAHGNGQGMATAIGALLGGLIGSGF